MPPKKESSKPRQKLPDSFGKDLTPEEADKFSKAFQQKEFRDLFFEYIKEISQPGQMEEYEKMISEAEAMNENKNVQINSVKQTTFPQPSAKSATAGLKDQQSKNKNKNQPKPKAASKPKQSQQQQPKGRGKNNSKQANKQQEPPKKKELPAPVEVPLPKQQKKPPAQTYPTIPHYEKIYVQDFNMTDYTLVFYLPFTYFTLDLHFSLILGERY